MRIYEGGGMFADWEPGERLVSIGVGRYPLFDRASAEKLIDVLEQILAAQGELRVVGNATSAEGVTLGYAMAWADFLRRHRAEIRLAVHSIPPSLNTLLRVVQWTTDNAVLVGSSEREARAMVLSAPVTIGAASGPSPS